ncbi:hypothetical protein [Psychrobacillus phage Perkons]|nr:hypothetical protein [Psychrobacillus phage Perkons]
MTFIVPFQEEFCQKIHTVYYVNNDTQGGYDSSVTTSEKCPHCEESHIFKVFWERSYREEDGYAIETYDCKCPKCRKEFDLEVDFELDI